MADKGQPGSKATHGKTKKKTINMKKFIFIIIAFLAIPFPLAAQAGEPESVKITWHMIVAIIAGLYEVVVRIIPTIGNYSWIAKIIEIIVWISQKLQAGSNFLNRKKK